MNTLEELKLQNHKTANYADYVLKKRHHGIERICCGWMEIHDDKDNLGENREIRDFGVKPLYWEEDGIFVLKFGGKFSDLTKEMFLSKKSIPGVELESDYFSFDPRKKHGFLPKSISSKINKKNFLKGGEYLSFVKDCCESQSPKLVWEWAF